MRCWQALSSRGQDETDSRAEGWEHQNDDDKPKNGREEINERLHEAIDGLRKDVTRVEIWATALGTFSQAGSGLSARSKNSGLAVDRCKTDKK